MRFFFYFQGILIKLSDSINNKKKTILFVLNTREIIMKRTLLVTLSALTLALTATPSLAEKPTITKSNQITPFNLVTRGYQGHFINQGIPSSGAFNRAVRTGQITANDERRICDSKR